MRTRPVTDVQAIERELHLPARTESLVLIGADDPELVRSVELAAMGERNAIDLRLGTARRVVPDGRAFLDAALSAIAPGRYAEIRIAFAEPDTDPDELIELAMVADDLLSYAHRREQARLLTEPPRYEVRYQPIVSMSERRTVGFESLMRASTPTGIIDAEALIAQATRDNWVAEFDQMGRTLALRGLGPWLGQGLLFLNVIAPDGRFDDAAVNDTIDQALALGLAPDQLVLEAVERNRYRDLQQAAAQIRSYRARGVRIAVDDVGDGHAGLRVLSAFEPDIVKIAGHLVADLQPATDKAGSSACVPTSQAGDHRRVRRGASNNSTAMSVISTLVDMAHRAGSWVVAENIETPEQFELLRRLEIDWGQGRHLGAPTRR